MRILPERPRGGRAEFRRNPVRGKWLDFQENEWEQVGNWMWENKDTFNGLSVLPYFGGTYTQAPFEDITEEQFKKGRLSLCPPKEGLALKNYNLINAT